MKKRYNCFLLMLLISTVCLKAQTIKGDELVGIHNIQEVDLAAITDPIEGSLAYNSTDEKLYVYTSTNGWLPVGTSTVVVKEITSNYTLLSSDTNKVLKVISNSNITITIPAGLPIGFNISAYQYGTGTVNFVGNSTTLRHRLNRFKIAGQYAGVGIISLVSDEFNFTGDLRK